MSGQSSIPDSSAPVTAAIYERLGVPRRINAAGTLTRLGGSLMAPAVLLAMAQAAEASVDISELQSAASGVIARCTGAQAGIVTSGAAAGLTLATAACLAGWDVNRMAALPDTRAMPNRILMARTHRNSYDHAIRLAGATIVDIGHNDRGTGAGVRGLEPWEIEAAIDANTAAFLFVATSETLADLPAVLDTVHRRGLPVIVDAAAQLPPRRNLKTFIEAGADLVVFSGGKAIGGPQSTGILAGRRDLVGSALVPQTWSPSALIDRDALKGIPHHGIGRGFKVGKEEIAGLLAALERFVERDEDAIAEQFTARLQAIATALSEAPSLTARLIARDGVDQHVPLLELTVAGSAHALSRHLQHGTPPVHLGERLAHQNVLTINPQTLRPDDDAVLVRCLIESSRSAV
jgi:L-seryl-tRNA(Ser) seleniumtransferase